jgi:hypothetical protein
MDQPKVNEVLMKLALKEQLDASKSLAVRQQTNAVAIAIANLNLNQKDSKNHD